MTRGPVLFLALWLLLLAGGRTKLFRDPGTFWHAAVGDKLLADGFFDRDPYSFTRAGEPWTPHQWLGEIALALAARVAGLDTQLVLTAAFLAGLFAWLGTRTLRTGLHPVLVIPLVGLTLAAGANHFHVRPHMLTIAALAVTAAALTDFDAGRLPVRKLWWLVPLYLVWSNVHGGMLGGLLTLGLAGCGWAATRLIGWPTPLTTWRVAGTFALITLACGLTAFVTPYGAGVARAWLAILAMGDLSLYVEEHAPLHFGDPAAWPLLALAGVYLAVLAGLREKPRVAWLLPLVWLVLAVGKVRHGPLFVVAAAVALADLWPSTVWAKRLAARRPDLYDPANPPRPTPPWLWAAAAVPVVGLVLLQAAGVGRGIARPDPDRWPVEALPVLADGAPRRVFNECEFGGYLIRYAPNCRVFFDDRFELYGPDMVCEFVTAGGEDTAGAMGRWQSRYGPFDTALVRPGGGFDTYFRDRTGEWRLMKETAAAVVYNRIE